MRDGKLLVIHRFKMREEYWVLPGGGVEDGEDIETALRREVWEETSLKCTSIKWCGREEVEDGRVHEFFQIETGEGEPVLGGPEAENMNSDNQYILTWLPVEEVLRLENFYPKQVLKYLNLPVS